MKKTILVALCLSGTVAMAQTQNLPKTVRDAFDKLFPNSVISSFTDNGSYNYTQDWNNDAYFEDFNYDGYPDSSYPYPIYGYEGDGYSTFYNEPYYYDNNLGYYNSYEYNVPANYVPVSYNQPTQYQVNFTLKGAYMTAIFKPNGTFIIAKGRVGVLPSAVQNAVMEKFKGQSFKMGSLKEEMITPEYPSTNPVYRVKVKVRHGDSHILKVDAKGTIVSSN